MNSSWVLLLDSEASQHLLGDVIHPACLMVFSRSDTPVVTEIPPLAWDACQSELDAPRVAPCQATGQLSLLGWAIRKRQLMSATCIRKTRFLFGFSLQVRTDGEHHPQVPSETNKNKKASRGRHRGASVSACPHSPGSSSAAASLRHA